MRKFVFEHVIYVRINEGNFCSLSIHLDWCWLLFIYKILNHFYFLFFSTNPYPFSYIIRQMYKQYGKLFLEFCENTHIRTHSNTKTNAFHKILQFSWIVKEGKRKIWQFSGHTIEELKMTTSDFYEMCTLQFLCFSNTSPLYYPINFPCSEYSSLFSNFTSIVLHIIIFYKLMFGNRMEELLRNFNNAKK